jgi:hypothetical protein
MAKKSWNTFSGTYPSATTFTASVSATLPIQMQFDKNKKKIPTPYGLFVMWANANLTGDWASTIIKGVGFAISVESENDIQLISNTFGTIGGVKSTAVANKTIQMNYKNPDYLNWAKKLGYKL